jgi:hypothetical protein
MNCGIPVEVWGGFVNVAFLSVRWGSVGWTGRVAGIGKSEQSKPRDPGDKGCGHAAGSMGGPSHPGVIVFTKAGAYSQVDAGVSAGKPSSRQIKSESAKITHGLPRRAAISS